MRTPVWILMIAALSAPLPGISQACTLWTAVGPRAAGGGVLIAKNRDSDSGRFQKIALVKPEAGYRYLALFATDDPAIDPTSTPVRAGLNEKGLVIVLATASSIPKTERDQDTWKFAKPGLLARLLRENASVDEVLAEKGDWFGPRFLLVADKTKAAIIEIGLSGIHAIHPVTTGVASHTNHYVLNSMERFNLRDLEGSKRRLNLIDGLLAQSSAPLTLNQFSDFSRQIWIKEGKVQTLGSWIVHLPPNGPAVVRTVLAEPGKPEKVTQLTADEIFR